MNLKSILKKIIVSILSILLIMDLNLIMLTIAMNETLLNPDFITKELEYLGFYSNTRDSIVQQLGSQSPEMNDILNRSISKEMVRGKINSLIYNAYSYLKSENDTLSLTVSFTDVKAGIIDNIKRERPGIPNAVLDEIANQIPECINLSEYMSDKDLEILEQLRDTFYYFNALSSFLYFLSVFLTILILVVTRDIGSFLHSLGFSLIMSGGLAYGLTTLTTEMFSGRIEWIELPQDLPIDIETVERILGDILEPFRFYGIIFVVVGVIFMIIATIISHYKEKYDLDKKRKKTRIEFSG